MAKTQLDHLKDHLRSGRSITPLEALGLYGIFRLAARVKELRDRGWSISTDVREDPNGKVYACYTLDAGGDHGLPEFATADSRKVA